MSPPEKELGLVFQRLREMPLEPSPHLLSRILHAWHERKSLTPGDSIWRRLWRSLRFRP